jgi:hypothetical protein
VNRLPTWRELHMDTSPEIEAIQLAFYRDATFWKKLQMMEQANQLVRTFAMIGLQERYPEATPEELRYRLVEMLYGEEMARKTFEYLASRERMNRS